MVKKTWLLCLLFLFCIRAIPVQSQTGFTNPTASQLHACGLPTNRSIFTDSATFTTFNMTADCTIGSAAVPTNGIYLHFQSGAFTINGNGHSINGGIFEGNTSVLQSARVILAGAATLQLQGCVIFRNNAGVIRFRCIHHGGVQDQTIQV